MVLDEYITSVNHLHMRGNDNYINWHDDKLKDLKDSKHIHRIKLEINIYCTDTKYVRFADKVGNV